MSPPNSPTTWRSGNERRSANPTLRVPEADSPTGELSLSPQCPAAPGYKSTRSHREQPRTALTKQVAQPKGNSWPASQHKTTAEATRIACTARFLRNRIVCSSVLACNTLAMKCACPGDAQKTTTPLPVTFPTPLRFFLRLLLPRRCRHNLVGIGVFPACNEIDPYPCPQLVSQLTTRSCRPLETK